MKKYLLSLVVLLVGAVSFTSCDNEEDTPQLHLVTTSNGAFVVCTGNMSGKIGGSISYLDYKKGKMTNDAFITANGRGLGDTPNDGIVYGSKVYLVVTGEHTIEVIDKNLKSVKQIKTTDLLGKKEGNQPRHIIAGAGAIWVTTYGGYVAVVDTATFKLRKSYKVGSYPEGLAGSGNNLFVANSDYGKGNGTISVINLTTGKVDDHKIEGIKNPQEIYIVNHRLYVLDWGGYDAKYNQIGAGLKILTEENGKPVAKDVVKDATGAAYYNGAFYTMNAPYGASSVSYSKLDVNTQYVSPLAVTIDAKTYSPASIAVDPATGHLFFSLYKKVGGYTSYTTPGSLKEFDNYGKEVRSAEIGIGPGKIFFNTRIDWK